MLQAKLWIENGERCLETSFKLPQPYIVYDASRVFEKYFLKLFTIVSVITSDQKHITSIETWGKVAAIIDRVLMWFYLILFTVGTFLFAFYAILLQE